MKSLGYMFIIWGVICLAFTLGISVKGTWEEDHIYDLKYDIGWIESDIHATYQFHNTSIKNVRFHIERYNGFMENNQTSKAENCLWGIADRGYNVIKTWEELRTLRREKNDKLDAIEDLENSVWITQKYDKIGNALLYMIGLTLCCSGGIILAVYNSREEQDETEVTR